MGTIFEMELCEFIKQIMWTVCLQQQMTELNDSSLPVLYSCISYHLPCSRFPCFISFLLFLTQRQVIQKRNKEMLMDDTWCCQGSE